MGLPDKVMGNSEVGHMTMGAGRIIYQNLVRINKAIQDKSFYRNKALCSAIEKGAQSKVHLTGLLSDAGVHSHIEHLFALIQLCVVKKVKKVCIHPIMDGRDTAPGSGLNYLLQLEQYIADIAGETEISIGSVGGRFYAMDRDKRWGRVDEALGCMYGEATEVKEPASQVVQSSYNNNVTDEFIKPVLLDQHASIAGGDSVIIWNYRADRVRQISSRLLGREQPLAALAGMTEYAENLKMGIAFDTIHEKNILSDLLEEKGLKQFRVAETEKYAHVTFFFNGGREAPYKGEDRTLIPSPKDCETYDEIPEMGAYQIADAAVSHAQMDLYDFMLMNFANADMVGHTGNYAATVKAMEALDACLAKVVGAAEQNGYHTLITADHGNAEEMQDCHGNMHTQHTLNPVPAIWVGG